MFHKQEKENSESSVLFVVEMYVGVAGLSAIQHLLKYCIVFVASKAGWTREALAVC